MRSPRRRFPVALAVTAVLLAAVVPAVAPAPSVAASPVVEDAPLEGVGADMAYRVFGKAKKNRPVLLQNSRPRPMEVFDDARGLFVPLPAYSDLELACRGKQRKLNLRYRDAFRESPAFQVVLACGREIQFVVPAQVAAPLPAPPPAPVATPAPAPVPATPAD